MLVLLETGACIGLLPVLPAVLPKLCYMNKWASQHAARGVDTYLWFRSWFKSDLFAGLSCVQCGWVCVDRERTVHFLAAVGQCASFLDPVS